MGKKALVLTYHIKKCKRIGGFHKFISFLIDDGFDVDWFTNTVSSAWIWHRNDRENVRNFFELSKGVSFVENNAVVRQFTVPVWMPAKLAKHMNRELYDHYWPSWKSIRRKLQDKYDVILVEGPGAQYATELKKDYPNARLIYRPSDVICTYTNIPDANEIEKKMIEIADITYCVDENQMEFYQRIGVDEAKIKILRNPLISQEQIAEFRGYKPSAKKKPYVIYIGVSGVDLDCIENAANKNRDIPFVVIGPFDRKSHDNITYTGTLTEPLFTPYLQNAAVGINPLVEKFEQINIGYTRKIIRYMRYLLPVVVTRHGNYRNVKGVINAEGYDEFSNKVREAYNMTMDERYELRDGYNELFESFSNETVRHQFDTAVLHGVY